MAFIDARNTINFDNSSINISFIIQNIASPKTYSFLKKLKENKKSQSTDPTLFSHEIRITEFIFLGLNCFSLYCSVTSCFFFFLLVFMASLRSWGWCLFKSEAVSIDMKYDSFLTIKWAMSWENLFSPYANNIKGADQPAHLRSLIYTFCILISTFVVCCLDIIITASF